MCSDPMIVRKLWFHRQQAMLGNCSCDGTIRQRHLLLAHPQRCASRKIAVGAKSPFGSRAREITNEGILTVDWALEFDQTLSRRRPFEFQQQQNCLCLELERRLARSNLASQGQLWRRCGPALDETSFLDRLQVAGCAVGVPTTAPRVQFHLRCRLRYAADHSSPVPVPASTSERPYLVKGISHGRPTSEVYERRAWPWPIRHALSQVQAGVDRDWRTSNQRACVHSGGPRQNGFPFCCPLSSASPRGRDSRVARDYSTENREKANEHFGSKGRQIEDAQADK